jgi:hypothetical protein
MRLSHGIFAGALTCLIVLSSAVGAEETPPPSTLSTTTTLPAPPQTSDNSAQAATPQGDEEIVCKKEPPPIGSRMGGKKVCRTVAEWRRIQAVAKETTDEIQSRKVPPPSN